MKKTVVLVALLSLCACVQTYAQTTSPTVPIPASAVTAETVTIKAAQLATLELFDLRAENAKFKAEAAAKLAAETQQAANEAWLKLVEQAGIKRADIESYYVRRADDGSLIFTRKRAPVVADKP